MTALVLTWLIILALGLGTVHAANVDVARAELYLIWICVMMLVHGVMLICQWVKTL